MANQTRKSKVAIRRLVLPEPVAESELVAAEQILARLVARAYVSDHADLFTAETKEQAGVNLPSSSVVPSVGS
jgi:hypothetical protein